MHWGVRRYQNKDGSYTKKGLERYNKARSKYDSAKETLNQQKSAYKNNKISKSEYKTSKTNLRTAKKELDKSYDKLKTDNLADEGKKLYQQGKTITSNTRNFYTSEAAVIVGATFAKQALSKLADQKTSMLASAAINIGGTFVNTMLNVKTSSDNKKLRAYYSHN